MSIVPGVVIWYDTDNIRLWIGTHGRVNIMVNPVRYDDI